MQNTSQKCPLISSLTPLFDSTNYLVLFRSYQRAIIHCQTFSVARGERNAHFSVPPPRLYVVKDHKSLFGGKPQGRFWSGKDPRQFSTWIRLLSRKRVKVNKNAKVCSNHFQFGKPVDSHPHPTLFLKGYDRETEITRKRKAPMERLEVQPTGRKNKRSDNYKQRVEAETSHILETPEREQNSTSESGEDPDRILVEKVIIRVSDTAKQDPVKKTSALKQAEVADACCREQRFVVVQ